MPSLVALLERGVDGNAAEGAAVDVAAVVTNPDRPAGRGMELQPSPVKAAALQRGATVLQPDRVRADEFHDLLRSFEPDVCVVVAYGKILPASLLQIPDHGFVNVHFSLLPAYRGAAPVQRAVMDGLDETGLSIMVLTEGMDEGPVLAERKVAIGPEETSGELGARLATAGADLLVPTLHDYVAGTLAPVEQDHSRATYAPKIAVEEAQIDWARPAATISALVRALNPSPGAWTMLEGTRLKVYRTRGTGSEGPTVAAGEIVAEGDRLLAGTGDAPLELVEVQPGGKKRMGGAEFARGLRLAGGERLG